jgi:hypothetical protein
MSAQPMFKREALWISFEKVSHGKNRAIKVSVGGLFITGACVLRSIRVIGVNAISGADKDSLTPPSTDQDYVVAGLQPWLDGIATAPGTVRQVL